MTASLPATPAAPGQSVCVLSHAHPDFSKGGGEIAAYRQHQLQRAIGWNSVFVAAADLNAGASGRRALTNVSRYAEDEFLFPFDRMTDDRLSWQDASQRGALVRFLAALDVQVFHLHHFWRIGLDLVADLMEARPDAKYVITLHEMLAICQNHGQMIKTRGRELCRVESPLRCLSCYPQQSIAQMLLRKAYTMEGLRRFDHVIYPSYFLRSRYEAWGLSRRNSVLENYLGDDLLAVPRSEPSGSNAHRFAFFGQPTAFKGLDILLRAMAILPQPEKGTLHQPSLTIFGADLPDILRLFPHMASLIEELGPSLILGGLYDPADAAELMKSFGWVIVPSIWWENSPVVIQEARRAGTPLIVSDIGGMAEKVVEGRDGMHFRVGNATDLARALQQALDPSFRAKMAESIADVVGRDEFLAGLVEAFAPDPRQMALQASV